MDTYGGPATRTLAKRSSLKIFLSQHSKQELLNHYRLTVDIFTTPFSKQQPTLYISTIFRDRLSLLRVTLRKIIKIQSPMVAPLAKHQTNIHPIKVFFRQRAICQLIKIKKGKTYNLKKHTDVRFAQFYNSTTTEFLLSTICF